MKVRKPRWLSAVEARMRPVDHWSRPAALSAGAALGVGAGALAGWTGEVWAAAVGAGALGVAGWLAASGKAVAVMREAAPKREAAPEAAVVVPVGKVPVAPRLSDALGMKELPGGTFWLGSEDGDPRAFDDEKPRQRVTVAPFAMARYVVRQSLYQAVMGNNPSRPQGDDLPANNISWFDAVRFCNRLSLREGHAPAYRIGEGDQPTVEWVASADGFRLPSEAEWEYAARAGTTTAYSFGDDEGGLEEHAWWAENAGGEPHPVGMKKPNPWGLFDVHGNVYEWCWDVFGSYGEPRPSVGDRVLRGGSFWSSNPGSLRSADRLWSSPERRDDVFGFRCARGLSPQP